MLQCNRFYRCLVLPLFLGGLSRTPIAVSASGGGGGNSGKNEPQCFKDNKELKLAVRAYIDTGGASAPCDPKLSVYGCNINDWCVRKIEDFGRVFFDQKNFNEDISRWDVSRATDTSRMFYGALSFNQNLNKWDTRNVKNMDYMFYGTKDFDINLKWDTRSVTSMRYMFANTGKFNQRLDWDVSKVETFRFMFSESQQFDSKLPNWNPQLASDMGFMFKQAKKFQQNMCAWEFLVNSNTKVTDMFKQTKCPVQDDPNLQGDKRGPFCYKCN